MKLKIEFLTQDDPLYVLPFFDEFVRHHAEQFEIVQISTSRTMGKRSRAQLLREVGKLYGPIGMTRLAARAAISRLLGSLERAKGAHRYYTLAQLSRAYGIPYAQIASPNKNEFVESVRRRAPDVLISVACPYILKEPLLLIPGRGAINIHHAPLPRYKGMMPTFWQMFHGEESVGLTIHYMVPKVDEGDVLYQASQAIEPVDSLDQLIQRSKRHGAHCMAEVLHQIANNTQRVMAPDHKGGSYFSFPSFNEIREFRRRGLRAI